MTLTTFSEILKRRIDDLMTRIDNNKASVIIIDGGLGEGKTTLAVLIADYINSKHHKPKVSLKAGLQLATGGEEFKEKIIKCYNKGLPTIIYDEAGDFNTRGFISTFNKELYKIFNICRAYKILIILCLPSFTDLDSGIFKTQAPRLLLNLRDRDNFKGNIWGYSLKSMIYMRHNINKYRIPPMFCYKTRITNFKAIFKDLDANRSKLLNNLSTQYKLSLNKELIKETPIKEDNDKIIDDKINKLIGGDFL